MVADGGVGDGVTHRGDARSGSPPTQLPAKERGKDRKERGDPRALEDEDESLAPKPGSHVRIGLDKAGIAATMGRASSAGFFASILHDATIWAVLLVVIADDAGAERGCDVEHDIEE